MNHPNPENTMKDNRTICNKTYMTPDEHIDLVADAKAAKTSASTLLRDCWLACRNGTRARRPISRPSLVPFQAKFAPGRAVRPQMHAFRS
jgi:hypothetical protein